MQERTARLIGQAVTLHADLAMALARSRSLIDHVRQRRRTSPFRVIRGGSDAGRGDAGLVVSTIADTKMCVPCIARHTGIPVEQIDALLRTVARTLRLMIGPHRCDACLQHKTTFSVTKDGHP